MDPERWQQVQTLFEGASERASDERAAYLHRACPDDPSLRALVESLLQGDHDVESRLDHAIREMFPAALDGEMTDFEVTATASRRRIGPYRILGELGRGGMSTVYRAERDDRQYQMQVAIKLVKRGMETEEIIRRLRQERQILASLDHPNIARLYDGGTTEDGLPYFVMELIDGVPIDRFCERNDLPLDARLELFREVCAAVHYAHQNLVVHRDLKPSNILVTRDGAPKLLDFGIAKLLDPDLLPGSLARTAPGMRLLTPEYASPEQVRGSTLTTATDIYSLGVLLYRLLVGQPPYVLRAHRPSELERVICEQQPARPSAMVEAVSLSRQLRGDLDNIVLKALEKGPQRRYASANQLAEDLRRHQIGLPVAARADTLGYLVGKFVRRHRVGVTSVLVVLLTLVAGIVATSHQARIASGERRVAQQARARAEAQQARAEQVRDFLIDIFEVSDPAAARGASITAEEVLRSAADRVASDLQEQPADRAMLMDAIARIYRNLGLYREARPLFEQALELRRQALGEPHVEVAASLNSLGELLYEQGDYEGAASHLEPALAMRHELLDPDDPQVAETLGSLAAIAFIRGDAAEAERLYRQVLQKQQRALPADDPLLAITFNNLAMVLVSRGEPAQAEMLYREALETQKNVLGHDHPSVADTLSNLASLLYSQRRQAAAEPLAQEALAIRRRVLGEHPDVATSLNLLAALEQASGDVSSAEALYREALGMMRRTLGDLHLSVSLSLTNLANLLQAKPAPAAAEPLFREALEILRRQLADDDPRVAAAESQLGACLLALGRHGEAEPLLLGSYPVLRRNQGADDHATRQARQALYQLYLSWGRPAEAAPYRDPPT